MTKISESVRINASGLHYRDLNGEVRSLASRGVDRVELANVYGQRYIGTNLSRSINIDIHGTPGNDLGAF